MAKKAAKAQPSVKRRRAKISITVDPSLLYAVDRYVQQRPDLDRSKVMERALANWYRTRQEEEMAKQFQGDDLVPDEEWQAWVKIRRAAAARMFSRRGPGR